MATTKDISEYTYGELKAHLDKLKSAEIESTKQELEKARTVVLDLEIKLEGLTGLPINPPKARGRRKGAKNKAPVGKSTTHKRKGGKTVKEAILEVLARGAATSKEITDKTGLKAGSINQALVILKKDKTIKQDGKRGGKYFVK